MDKEKRKVFFNRVCELIDKDYRYVVCTPDSIKGYKTFAEVERWTTGYELAGIEYRVFTPLNFQSYAVDVLCNED